MHVVLTLSMDDLARLSTGERVMVHNNVFIEINRELNHEEQAKIVRTIKKSQKRYHTCPSCKGKSFVNNSCCRKCEGSGRLLTRDEIRVGDEVVIKKFIMAPWGWPAYPKPKDPNAHVPIATGKRGIVIAISDTSVEDPNFTIDYVEKGTLRRSTVEGQYVRLPGEED